MTGPSEAYAATEAAVIWVDGPDAEHFLHGLLSNDVAALAAGDDCPALLLDNKGHLEAMLLVHRGEQEAFTLLTDPSTAARTVELLHEFHFSEDLEITGPEPSNAVLVIGDAPAPEGAELVLTAWIPGARIALVAEAWPDDDSGRAERLRVEAGIPRVGVDTAEKTLPHEIGLVAGAVSFEKGCYLGQETVARVEYRGGVRRHLRGVRAEVPLSAGLELLRDGKAVGTITSALTSPSLGHIGLGVLRDGEEPVQTASGQRVEVVALPFSN